MLVPEGMKESKTSSSTESDNAKCMKRVVENWKAHIQPKNIPTRSFKATTQGKKTPQMACS